VRAGHALRRQQTAEEETLSRLWRNSTNSKRFCLRYFNVYGLNQRYDAYGNVIPIFAQFTTARKIVDDLW
jgi:nucleoside-diphosphate-sugar epimerase